MTMPRALVLLLLLVVAWPTAATAGVTLVTREVAAGDASKAERGERTVVRVAAPARFNLVGIHWRGSGGVEFRTQSASGAWSAWRRARPEAEDGPDAGTGEADRVRGWKIGNPWWTGTAMRIQYRTTGRVTRIRTHFLWSPVEAAPRAPLVAGQPKIISRGAWGANESIVRDKPGYADELAFAVVHHTAGARPSSPSESAAIVRGIQAYHVRSNGWDDIGYNFLFDRFGQVFEGRAGGIGKNVIGAHAKGFNTGSVGVAAIGTYGSSGIGTTAKSALVALLAWRLDVGHVDPLSRVRRVSLGSPRFPEGRTVTLNAIGGHRDTGLTSCPGTALYGQLASIRSGVAARGLPKLYSPSIAGELGGPIRFRGRLSAAAAWKVTVTNGSGATVASGTGSGTAIDWTWGSAGSPPGAYFYSMEGDSTTRPATGPVGSIAPFELWGVDAAPALFTPNGDGVREQTTLRFSTSRPAWARILLKTPGGATVASIMSGRWVRAGTTAYAWDGRRADRTPVPDGSYQALVEVTSGTEQLTGSIGVVIDRTLGSVALDAAKFSPNGDGRRDEATVSFALANAADVRVVARNTSGVVETVFDAPLGAGAHEVAWDGIADGVPVRDGAYELVVSAATTLGTRMAAGPVVVDTVPPVLTWITAVRSLGGTLVRFTTDEPVWVTLSYGSRAEAVFRSTGRRRVWRPNDVRTVLLVARDGAGNAGPTITRTVRSR